MKTKIISTIFFSATILFVLLTVSGCASSKPETDFKLRDYNEIQLENGLKVLLINDQSLPYFSLNLLLATGSRDDESGRAGLANFVGELLTKGTRKHSALSFADELGQMGAEMNVSVGQDSTSVSASSLSFDQEKMLALFSEAILQPAFSKKEIDRLKQSTVAILQKQVDIPEAMAAVAFNDYIYDGNAYASSVSGLRSTVESFQQKHVNRFYLTHYRPNNASLVVVGKLSGQIEEVVRKNFGGWQSRPLEKDQPVIFPESEGRRIRLVYRDDLKQSQVRFGWAGIQRNNEDYLKIQLANTILGGAFASRLSDRIRIELGLTYGVYSYFSAKKDQGTFVVSTSTRNEKVGVMVKETLALLEKFHSEGVSEKEVEQAKGLMVGRFPRSIETAEAFASEIQSLRFYGVSEKYLSRFLGQLSALKVRDINDVIKKYFDPKNVQVLIYAPRSVSEQIKEVAPVEEMSHEKIEL